MPSDPASVRSRQLLVLAVLALLLAVLWCVRTPCAPDADRYDYLGRAANVLQGEGPRPLVVYPLRLAFDGAASLPPENLTRPPLWPLLLAPLLRLGADENAGVLLGAIGLLTLLPLMRIAGDRSLGAGAGGFGALALVASFATVRALWGGGPEAWLALLLFVAWTWNASGRGGSLGLGAILGTMPWLHPVGWIYAALGLCARVGRTAPRHVALAGMVAGLLGVPWYLEAGRITGTPLSPLQGQAELAKSVLDPGGLGPYRGLDPMPSIDVVREHTAAWLHQWTWNGKELLLHLDAWLAWPLVLLAIVGAARDRALALRDAALLGLAFVMVANVARDPRLLLPVLPVACIWAGAGFRSIGERAPRRIGVGLAALMVASPWALPLGASMRPGDEVASIPLELRDPSREDVLAAGAAGSPVFIDSSVLAWRARSVGVLIPDSPPTLERLRAHPALAGATSMVLHAGTRSAWLGGPSSAWSAWLAERTDDAAAHLLVLPLDPPASTVADTLYVPERLSLSADDRPDDLVDLAVPPAAREGLQLRREAAAALSEMIDAAAADGIHLRVVSAYRSYERQQQLHRDAVARHGADQKWVAAPGTSEHQLGTTVDLADAAMRHVLDRSFADAAEGRWLAANAQRFGFVRSYTEENQSLSGYEPEPWHYRHRPEVFDREGASPR